MPRWLCLVDIDQTLVRVEQGLSVHPLNQTEWARRLDGAGAPMGTARAGLLAVSALADVAILSDRPIHTLEQTRAWFRRYFPGLTPVQIHLLPEGAIRRDHKPRVCAQYQRAGRKVCAIDDFKYAGPSRFFIPPQGWVPLLDFLKSDPATPPQTDAAPDCVTPAGR